jgi:hypothetical protein
MTAMRVLRFRPVASLFALLLLTLAVPRAHAQDADRDADRDAAYAVVTRLFDSMRSRDTAAMRAAFVPNASMQSLAKEGVRFEGIEGWITSVGRAPATLLLDERLANPVVQVSGDLASVWVDYWFFAGDRLSHCGVDAIHLYRQDGTWRIFSIVDTRQREGCPPAPSGTKPE